MPRNPDNNPTDRIIRLIEEYTAHIEYENYLLSFFPPNQDLPPRPSVVELEKEKVRQHLTKPHTVIQREYRRNIRMLAKDHGFQLPSASRKALVITGNAAYGVEETSPLVARTSHRRSIVDENKPLDADAEALVEQLKNASFTFAKPTIAEVMEKIAPKSQAEKEKEEAKAREEAAKAGKFFTPTKPEDDGTA